MAARRVGSLIRQSEGVQHTAARAYYVLLAVIGLPIHWVDERIGLLSSIQKQLNCISGHWPTYRYLSAGGSRSGAANTPPIVITDHSCSLVSQ